MHRLVQRGSISDPAAAVGAVGPDPASLLQLHALLSAAETKLQGNAERLRDAMLAADVATLDEWAIGGAAAGGTAPSYDVRTRVCA
jgi:hypothetical protein